MVLSTTKLGPVAKILSWNSVVYHWVLPYRPKSVVNLSKVGSVVVCTTEFCLCKRKFVVAKPKFRGGLPRLGPECIVLPLSVASTVVVCTSNCRAHVSPYIPGGVGWGLVGSTYMLVRYQDAKKSILYVKYMYFCSLHCTEYFSGRLHGYLVKFRWQHLYLTPGATVLQ
jgi:hypothetical protein